MIVVGGGVGGLATAGRLAKEGLSVVVLEKNVQVRPPVRAPLAAPRSCAGSTWVWKQSPCKRALRRAPIPQVGGRAQSVVAGGCRFDTGPSLLLFPDKYREVGG